MYLFYKYNILFRVIFLKKCIGFFLLVWHVKGL